MAETDTAVGSQVAAWTTIVMHAMTDSATLFGGQEACIARMPVVNVSKDDMYIACWKIFILCLKRSEFCGLTQGKITRFHRMCNSSFYVTESAQKYECITSIQIFWSVWNMVIKVAQ